MRQIAAALVLLASLTTCAPATAHAQEPSNQQQISKKERAALFRKGAQLWPVYCAQCHSPRPSGDYASYQWDVLIPHMRTLGNIPADDANAILVYLKGGH
jgi:mono/diheme cytochrome c family protein